MANSIARTTRSIQVYSPLPDDVLPNIMLRVEDRQDFKRLACTCHGFYAWSEPWLKSRRQAAELGEDPQRLLKLPAWIKTHSRHLHPADCVAPQGWNNAGEARLLVDVLKRSMAFTYAFSSRQPPAPSATEDSAAHLDFVFFSPRLLPDVNEEVFANASERLVANACFALAGFEPSGEAWQCDVLSGAVAWLDGNADRIGVDARSRLLTQLNLAMMVVMVTQASPAIAMQLLAHGLAKSYQVKDAHLSSSAEERWENPLLTALVMAAANGKLEAGSAEACAFLGAIGLVVSRLAQTKERAALAVTVGRLDYLMALLPEKTWTPGSKESAWLPALVQGVRDMPDTLATIREILIQRDFIRMEEWNALLAPVQRTFSAEPG